jgi:hypothetical protein
MIQFKQVPIQLIQKKIKKEVKKESSFDKLINAQLNIRKNSHKEIESPFITNRELFLVAICKICNRRKSLHFNNEWQNLVGLCQSFVAKEPIINIGIRIKSKSISNFNLWLISNKIIIPPKGSKYWWRLFERFMLI